MSPMQQANEVPLVLVDPHQSDLLRLHVGCGPARLEGWLNCDLYAGENVDVVYDLQARWPFRDNTASAIYGSHVLEHLADFRTFFAEAHRVLVDSGQLIVRTPYGNHRSAWWDVSHLRPWFAESFCHLQPGYQDNVGNQQHRDIKHYFEVMYCQLRVSAQFARFLDRRWKRRLFLPWVLHVAEAVEELFVGLRALKSPQQIEQFLCTHNPAAVPIQLIMYQHDLEQRPLYPGDTLTLLRLGVGHLQGAYSVGKEK